MRHLLLVFLFVFAQAGALAHALSHHPAQTSGDEPVCEQCLAFAPMAAAAASTPLAWSAPASHVTFEIAFPASFHSSFQPLYQSRAPPRL